MCVGILSGDGVSPHHLKTRLVVIPGDLSTYVTLLGTNISPENGWLEDDPFLLGKRPIFRGVCC